MRRAAAALLLLSALIGGCEQAMQDMYEQPRYAPLAPSELFPDRMSARPLPRDSVPARRGAIAGTSSGREGIVPEPPRQATVYPLGPDGRPLAMGGEQQPPVPVEERPPITLELVRRGKERFDIYCLPCHSPLGDGDGVVVRRGFPDPPSYHTERLRRAPDQHFYDVMTRGYGIMYSYAARVSPQDRWAVTAYIRALQRSQNTRVGELGEEARRRLGANGG